MSENVAVEADTGAQLLPRLMEPHPRQRWNSWIAWQCLSADHRAKHGNYREIAAQIIVKPVTGDTPLSLGV